jgi:O-antigen/teichoic acid export membrane protein
VFAALGLVTFLLMIRILDKELYGRWIIYITVASLLDMLRMGLTGTAAIRLISTATCRMKGNAIAASYHLSIFTSLSVGILFLISYSQLHRFFPDSYYLPVLLFYPLLSISNLSYNQANILSQGIMNFKRFLVIRVINGSLTFAFISGYILFTEPSLHGIIMMHIFANALSSGLVILMSWDGLQYFRQYHLPTIKKIIKFGKYSSASSVGSSLLRSSDTILLSMSSVMGAEAIAIYAIPMKFIELVEILLRSFTATAFPKLSKAFKYNRQKFIHLLSLYVAGTCMLLLPIIAALILFSGILLQVVGGNEYMDSLALQKSIVQIVAIYIFFLPFDRFSGVALFAIDKPGLNFKKIAFMLLANIVFDCIAIFVFHSLVLVALATLLFTLAGIGMGWYFVFSELDYSFKRLLINMSEHIIYFMSTLKKQRNDEPRPI